MTIKRLGAFSLISTVPDKFIAGTSIVPFEIREFNLCHAARPPLASTYLCRIWSALGAADVEAASFEDDCAVGEDACAKTPLPNPNKTSATAQKARLVELVLRLMTLDLECPSVSDRFELEARFSRRVATVLLRLRIAFSLTQPRAGHYTNVFPRGRELLWQCHPPSEP